MPEMPPYPVQCDCQSPAEFKIASEWSDGPTRELKTYFLSCAGCLRSHLERACEKQRTCRVTPGETLERPGVYELVLGGSHREIIRRTDLEWH